MRAVVQRVKGATLHVGDKKIAQINAGLVVYLAISKTDDESHAEKVAKKICGLRIFEDQNGKMNLSVKDINGEILLVSQFTLYGDVAKGFRPSFSNAQTQDAAKELFDITASLFAKYNVPLQTGVFGADMQIMQHNDGPVTIIYEV